MINHDDYRVRMELDAARAKARKNSPLLGRLVLVAIFCHAVVMIINTMSREARGPAAVIAAAIVVFVSLLERKQ